MTIFRLVAHVFTCGAALAQARQGNVAVTFALVALPMMTIAGACIQYSDTARIQARMSSISDEVALSAVSATALSRLSSESDNGQSAALSLFNSLAGAVQGVTLASANVKITSKSGTLTASVSYTATVSTALSSLIGNAFSQISGAATASASLPIYSNFYLLLDGSPSMGIGASPSDIAAMQAANNGCAFACHAPDALDPSVYPGYTLPNVPGTQLRIDVLRSATSQLISTAISQEVVANQFQIGLYTFANKVTTLTDLTSNLTTAQTLASGIQLPTTDIGTQIGDSVNWLSQNKVTAVSGSGTQASPVEYVFLVTDGVEDQAFNYIPGSYDNLPAPRGTWNGVPYGGTMLSSACSGLKNKGVTVAVLYTNYDPLSDVRYTDMVQPFASNIATALQNCASTGFFFQADYASDITAAMQAMFAAALNKSAHLTQ